MSIANKTSEANAAFKGLANAQRYKPELAMLEAQKVLSPYPSGNTLGWLMEHVGDLTHRMSEYGAGSKNARYSKEFVAPKVYRALNAIKNPIDYDRIKQIPDLPELKAYSEEHSKLPVYNRVHQAARDAAVSLGQKDLFKTEGHLQYLHDMLKSSDAYDKEAGSYKKNFEPQPDTTEV